MKTNGELRIKRILIPFNDNPLKIFKEVIQQWYYEDELNQTIGQWINVKYATNSDPDNVYDFEDKHNQILG